MRISASYHEPLVTLLAAAALLTVRLGVVKFAQGAEVRWIESEMRMRRARLDVIDAGLALIRHIALADDAAVAVPAEDEASERPPLRT